METKEKQLQLLKELSDTAKVLKETFAQACASLSAANSSAQSQTHPSEHATASPTNPSTTSMAIPSKRNHTALIVAEPDPSTLYPDADLSDKQTVGRLLTLFQASWTLSRGRGPRDQDTCSWCRGPMASEVQILTHAGKDNNCRNSWHATCLLQWLEGEFKSTHFQRLRCPMCRLQLFDRTQITSLDFYALQAEGRGYRAEDLDAAWVRLVVFSPEYAKDICGKAGKQLLILDSKEMRQVHLWGATRYVFELVEQIPRKVQNRFMEHHMLWKQKARKELATRQQDQNADKGKKPEKEVPEQQEMEETTWVMINWGHNEFRLSPYLPQEATSLEQSSREAGISVRRVTAEEFKEAAKMAGGLQAAIQGYEADEGEMVRMRESGKQFVQDIIEKGPGTGPDGLKEFNWYTRIAATALVDHGIEPPRQHPLGGYDYLVATGVYPMAAFHSESEEEAEEEGEEAEEEEEEDDEEEEPGDEEEESNPQADVTNNTMENSNPEAAKNGW